MPDLKVIYIAGFNVDKNTGRSKATREKAAALRQLLSPGAFSFYYPATSSSRVIAYLKVLFFDMLMLWRLFFVDKNSRIIERTTFLPFTNIYLWLRGVRIIYELHTDFKDEIKHYHVGVFEKLVLHGFVLFERMNLWLASGIIYNHPILREKMAGQYKKPSIYTYNGANVHDFVPLDKQECRRSLGLNPSLHYYVFIGSIARWRGVDLLVEIFNKYMSDDDVLLVVGDASHKYGQAVKNRAISGGRVIFKDEVEVKEVVKYINAADVCLVPVKPVLTSPGNPLKLYDYIACGKPVIGQENITGCSDEIKRYAVGIVTDFYNPLRASAEMRAFCIQHDAEFYRLHNRKVAEKEISWEKRMKEWLAFFLSFSG